MSCLSLSFVQACVISDRLGNMVLFFFFLKFSPSGWTSGFSVCHIKRSVVEMFTELYKRVYGKRDAHLTLDLFISFFGIRRMWA